MQSTELSCPEWSPLFEGHFDDAPILSGVAQLALIERLLARGPQPRTLASVERVRFKATAGPREALGIELTDVSDQGRLRFTVRRGDATISEGVLRVR